MITNKERKIWRKKVRKKESNQNKQEIKLGKGTMQAQKVKREKLSNSNDNIKVEIRRMANNSGK